MEPLSRYDAILDLQKVGLLLIGTNIYDISPHPIVYDTETCNWRWKTALDRGSRTLGTGSRIYSRLCHKLGW